MMGYMDFKYEIIDNCMVITGTVTTEYCDVITETIDIPSVINGLNVIGINNYSFKLQPYLKSINIPNSVINIGRNAFFTNTHLTEINGVKLKEGVNIINNKFIYHERRIYTIKYQICDDYCDDDELFINNNYFRFTFETIVFPIIRRVIPTLFGNTITIIKNRFTN